MKVRVDNTVEVSEEQKILIANVLDEKESKRRATRDEARDYIWSKGSDWEHALSEEWSLRFEEPKDEEDESFDSLL